jgi:peptidoglycan/xylan/chitin deacetylase (PgdA/CDA1 family)
MNSSQLLELNNNGWDIANHTKSHVYLGALTQAEVEAELNDCKVFLDGLGLSRASLHVAYPFDDYSGNTLAAMAEWGAKTGRKGGAMGDIWVYPYTKYEGDGQRLDIDDFPYGIVTIFNKKWVSNCDYISRYSGFKCK